MASKGSTQSLPPKEASLFKSVIKLYESKQYKKGVKTADQILKKYPEVGCRCSAQPLPRLQMLTGWFCAAWGDPGHEGPDLWLH